MLDAHQRKIDKIRDKIHRVINKAGLSPRDLFLLWVILGYDIGESIHGQPETVETLEKLYYSRPTLGAAMMLQSKIALSWLEDIVADGKDTRAAR